MGLGMELHLRLGMDTHPSLPHLPRGMAGEYEGSEVQEQMASNSAIMGMPMVWIKVVAMSMSDYTPGEMEVMDARTIRQLKARAEKAERERDGALNEASRLKDRAEQAEQLQEGAEVAYEIVERERDEARELAARRAGALDMLRTTRQTAKQDTQAGLALETKQQATIERVKALAERWRGEFEGNADELEAALEGEKR